MGISRLTTHYIGPQEKSGLCWSTDHIYPLL